MVKNFLIKNLCNSPTYDISYDSFNFSKNLASVHLCSWNSDIDKFWQPWFYRYCMFEPFMCCLRICTSLTCKMCILRTNFLKKLTKLFLANGICELCSAIQEGQIEMRTVWFIILGTLGQKSFLEPANRVWVFGSGTDINRRWNLDSM